VGNCHYSILINKKFDMKGNIEEAEVSGDVAHAKERCLNELANFL